MPRISDAVKQDHALIKSAFRRLRDANPENRKPDEFVWALDRYLIVDDLVVAPALEHHIAHGGERHRRLSDDFDSMNAKLRHMQRFSPAEPSFDSALHAIWVDLEPHVREESASDLRRLEESLSQSESEELGKKYEDLKELLQRPYGENGVPDDRTLSAVLEMPRQELMVKLGISEE
ncbi:f8d1e3e5-63cc-45f6-b006-baf3dd2df20a [Thermothielavioides terrestris]|uniref:Hemerythrin-like domain-containing protein n=2 Tax=Thermothielavioides terrestris TaxID=2587410 RepID=G2R6X4_THETT|nr:uncharacterized protein THITE_2118102 [Thermothielavioides terrestris NRRL 8126]AEO68552.1 hypothetical protein THITE_2118102 [Thermothielavioides terrestris NRRL 8126]SPQ24173.1 f8d1e3e5-63cc-45f6-b006-baf3dd2df20a [Thermothielavioides terrestris]